MASHRTSFSHSNPQVLKSRRPTASHFASRNDANWSTTLARPQDRRADDLAFGLVVQQHPRQAARGLRPDRAAVDVMVSPRTDPRAGAPPCCRSLSHARRGSNHSIWRRDPTPGPRQDFAASRFARPRPGKFWSGLGMATTMGARLT